MNNYQKENLEEILIKKEEIEEAIKKAASWIEEEYKDIKEPIVLIGLLKGCIPFLGKLITQINRDVILDFMVVSSFKGNTFRESKPEIVTNIISDVEGKHLLFVEDIIDSGLTVQYTMKEIGKRKPASMKLITLLDKPSGRLNEFNADYSCFKIEDKFVVGFGLDYKEIYRNYDSIGVLKKELISKN